LASNKSKPKKSVKPAPKKISKPAHKKVAAPKKKKVEMIEPAAADLSAEDKVALPFGIT